MNPDRPDTSAPLSPARYRWLLGGILLLGLVARAVLYLDIRHDHLFTMPFLDSADYDAWARRLLAGDWGRGEPYWMGPLYPHLLALVYWLGGPGPVGIAWLQWLLSLAGVAMTAEIARRWADRATGLVAAGLYVLYGPPVFYASLRLMATVVTVLLLAVAWQAWRAVERPVPRRWLVLGLLVGVTAWARGNVLLLLALLPLLLIPRGAPPVPARRRACVLALWLGGALAVLPVTVRNVVVGGDLVLLTSNFGVNLLIGQQSQYGGIFGPIEREPTFEFDPTGEIQLEAELGRELAPSEVSRRLAGRAVQRVLDDPAGIVAHTARKAYRFWSGYELPQITSWNFWRPRLAPLAWFVVPFTLLAALGLPGAAVLRPQARRVWLVLVVGYWLSLLPFFPTSRYRLAVVPLIAIAAARAVTWAVAAWREGRNRPVARLAAAALVTAAVLWPAWSALDPADEAWHGQLNRASRAADAGDREAVVAACTAAEAVRPGHPETPYRLGGYLEKVGDTGGALAAYREAEQRAPDEAFIPYRRGRLLAAAGRPAEAEQAYRRAAVLDPAWAYPHHGLALVLREEGDLAGAVLEMRRAVALDPGRQRFRLNLAALEAESGRLDEAERLLVELTAEFPHYAPGWLNLVRVRWEKGETAAARQALARARELPGLTADETAQARQLADLLAAGPPAASPH